MNPHNFKMIIMHLWLYMNYACYISISKHKVANYGEYGQTLHVHCDLMETGVNVLVLSCGCWRADDCKLMSHHLLTVFIWDIHGWLSAGNKRLSTYLMEWEFSILVIKYPRGRPGAKLWHFHWKMVVLSCPQAVISWKRQLGYVLLKADWSWQMFDNASES